MQKEEIFVMLVDDNKSLLSELVESIKSSIDAPKLLSFSSSIRAMEFAESNVIDTLISDFDMPHYNGVELACAVKVFHPRARIIIMSGKNVNGNNWNRGWYFLQKPFAPEQILEILLQ